MPAAATTSDSAALEQLVSRAGELYSLPVVAAEVLRLTNSPKVDVPALKACIEQDPALTVKLLRVVNSSLFGLPREVGGLNQALGLLGIKPLKLLVLGFSLPENLFLEVARDQLDWYWNSTLARAVAAREISEQLFGKPGDDAFLAGLLQDLGVLALLGQLGRPYAELLSEAMANRLNLSEAERGALGFDHTQLTAGLLERWNMPPLLIKAISEPRDYRLWAHNRADHAPLVRVLHLAELFAQLVGQRRLSVLPDLLQAGEAYCNLDKPRLNDLVAGLEPKVRQLASVLSLDASRSGEYSQILIEAHKQMARVAETVAAQLSLGITERAVEPCEGEDSERQALALARQLRASFDSFFNQCADSHKPALRTRTPAERAGSIDPGRETRPLPAEEVEHDQLAVRLTLAVGHCRSTRQPLSVVLFGAEGQTALKVAQEDMLERLLDAACQAVDVSCNDVVQPGPLRRVLVLAGKDRRAAVLLARGAVEQLRRMAAPLQQAGRLPPCTPAAGVAAVSAPAKNFQSPTLLETAQRCLTAALTAGGVKSLEVI